MQALGMPGNSAVVAGVVVSLSAALAGTATAQLLETFDNNTAGWTAVQFSHSAHIAAPATAPAGFTAAGFPGGALSVGDVMPNTGIAAPPAWLGDKSAYLGGSISFDMFIAARDNATYAAVGLNAGTFTLKYPLLAPPIGQWVTITVPLSPEGWRLNTITGGAPATQAQMEDALGDLVGLYIRTEWRTGPTDNTRVDNIRLNLPPCDLIDFNNDGVFPDDQDLTDFIFVLGGGACATCNDVDFNNDGVFPDDQDLEVFLFVLGGGSC